MNIEHFKTRLLDKERELTTEVARIEAELQELVEPDVRDEEDEATVVTTGTELTEQGKLAAQTLQDVRDALQRMKDGTYGKCEDCGRPIEPARLEAVPWARYCLKDQEKHDKAAHVPVGGSAF